MGWKAALTRLTGLALLALALLLAWSQAPERPVESLVERWAQRPSQFLQTGELVLHLRDEGPRSDRQPLVLLHGLGGSLHDWEAWATALRRTHRVIRLDLPGSGLSEAAPDGDYGSAADARRVLALLDQLRVPSSLRLVGQGRGGEVAAQMALLAPGRVRQLLLVAGAPAQTQALPVPLRVAAALPWPRWLVSMFLPRALVDRMLRWLYGDPSLVTPALVDRRQELLQSEGNRWALRQQWRQRLSEPEAAALYSRLDLPVLLLWGTADPLTPLAQARALQSSIPGSALLQVDGAGHLPQEEAPARSLAAVQPFIEGP